MYVESLRRLSGSAIGSRCGVLDINAGADLEGVAVVTGANLVSRSFVNSNKSNMKGLAYTVHWYSIQRRAIRLLNVTNRVLEYLEVTSENVPRQ